MPKQSKRIALLLDGDYLLFSAMSAAEEEVDWGEDIWSLQCDQESQSDPAGQHQGYPRAPQGVQRCRAGDDLLDRQRQ